MLVLRIVWGVCLVQIPFSPSFELISFPHVPRGVGQGEDTITPIMSRGSVTELFFFSLHPFPLIPIDLGMF